MRQVFIIMVGFSQSGKTTLAKKIQDNISKKLIRIDSTSIHKFLNKTYPVFQDDNTVQGKSYELRQKTTKSVQNVLLNILLSEGYSIILDSCNLSLNKRKNIIEKVKKINNKINTIIIHIKVPEEQLYKSLQKADKQNIKIGEKKSWVNLYEKVQKAKFDVLKENEAKYLITYLREGEKAFFNGLRNIINV